MPLSSRILRGAIRQLFEPSNMKVQDPLRDWIAAYASYAQPAIAGPVALALPLPQSGSGEFDFNILDSALRTMWMSATWAGPGVTAVTSLVPPLQPHLVAIVPTLISSFDVELAPTLIAEALHTYTLSIVVTVTPASGTPFPATVA